MGKQIPRPESKRRVKIVGELAQENMLCFMKNQIGKKNQILVETNNIGRTPDDIAIKIKGAPIAEKTIFEIDLKNIDEKNLTFVTETDTF